MYGGKLFWGGTYISSYVKMTRDDDYDCDALYRDIIHYTVINASYHFKIKKTHIAMLSFHAISLKLQDATFVVQRLAAY